MKTPDISGNLKGRKPRILGWKWCEGKLLLFITLDFCRLQRGSYLKGSSDSHEFSASYNPQGTPTSTGYNLFFFKLQHRKRQKSLNHNIKSQMLITSFIVLLSSLLLHCFLFSLCISSLAAHQLSYADCFSYKKVLLPFHIVYFIRKPYWLFVFFARIWNESLSLRLPKAAHKLVSSLSVLKKNCNIK